jgi:hypothetical protein
VLFVFGIVLMSAAKALSWEPGVGLIFESQPPAIKFLRFAAAMLLLGLGFVAVSHGALGIISPDMASPIILIRARRSRSKRGRSRR